MRNLLHTSAAVVLLLLASRPAVALDEGFATPLGADWAAPSTPLIGASVMAAVPNSKALDGRILELVYPGHTPATDSGPGWATQLQTAATRGYGVYTARLRTAAAPRRGLVSAFFTYFNDGVDHDADGIIDNHEIDYEFLAAEPSAIYLTVWTAYQADMNGEVFRKVTRKVDLKTGRVWQTPPGGEGTYDLVEIAPLAWKVRGFASTRRFRTYRFDWETSEVTFAVDLEDGQGFRTLWDLTGAPNTVIPTHPAPCFVNLWHNATHWNTGLPASPPLGAARFRIDRITLP